MRQIVVFVALFLSVPTAHCGEVYARVSPVGNAQRKVSTIPAALALETRATIRDLATFRNPEFDALTIAQIAASIADAKTSLTVFRRRPDYGEVGVARFIVGIHPDSHKYILAGAVEIGIETIAAHYLRTHGPVHRWYWRPLWAVPQTAALYGHARASILNLGNY